MKAMFRFFALITMVALVTNSGWAATKYDDKFAAAEEVLQDAISRSQNAVPKEIIRSAKAIAIFPDVMKAGFIFGARYGEGVFLVQDDMGRWSAPAYFSMTGLSAGLLAGMESTDVVFTIMNKKGLDAVLKQRLTIGADISIAAGPGSIGTEGNKDIFLHADIYSYVRSRGIFAGVSLNGARIGESRRANRALYGENSMVNDITMSKSTMVPAAAKGLVNALNAITAK